MSSGESVVPLKRGKYQRKVKGDFAIPHVSNSLVWQFLRSVILIITNSIRIKRSCTKEERIRTSMELRCSPLFSDIGLLKISTERSIKALWGGMILLYVRMSDSIWLRRLCSGSLERRISRRLTSNNNSLALLGFFPIYEQRYLGIRN